MDAIIAMFKIILFHSVFQMHHNGSAMISAWINPQDLSKVEIS
jgi:hypothetical protein